MITRYWKVYGIPGHRQRESFHSSKVWDFSSEKNGVRILEIWNADRTGTNEYTIIGITRETEEQCEAELWGQITDGLFENSRTGYVIEI